MNVNGRLSDLLSLRGIGIDNAYDILDLIGLPIKDYEGNAIGEICNISMSDDTWYGQIYEPLPLILSKAINLSESIEIKKESEGKNEMEYNENLVHLGIEVLSNSIIANDESKKNNTWELVDETHPKFNQWRRYTKSGESYVECFLKNEEPNKMDICQKCGGLMLFKETETRDERTYNVYKCKDCGRLNLRRAISDKKIRKGGQ